MSSPVAPTAQSMSRNTDVQYTEFTSLEKGVICGTKAVMSPCFPCYYTIIDDFQRAVILRLGKRVSTEAGKGGIYVVWPCIDELIRVDIRETTVNVPNQSIVTREGLTVFVDGVVYYRITDAIKTVFGVQNYHLAVTTLAQTKLREVLGLRTFEQLQNDREGIAQALTGALEEPTRNWGINVTRVELTDVKLPKNIQRAMGQEAEATRKAKGKVIEANGELKAAQILLNAANTMAGNQSAMQLRFLQTLTNVSAENNRTIIMPYPSEITDGARSGGGSSASSAQALLTSAVSALAAQDGSA